VDLCCFSSTTTRPFFKKKEFCGSLLIAQLAEGGQTQTANHRFVTRGEERSSEALIEAWAASVMTSEHLEVAVKDRTASRNSN